MLKKILVIATFVALAACGDKPVPQDIVDQNMTISRLNAQKNADSYLPQAYPPGTVESTIGLAPSRVLMQSDSTISKDCRFGDGWASGNIEFPNGKKISVKCQTNGTGKGISGCMTNAEFQSKTYKGEEGSCQNLEALPKFK